MLANKNGFVKLMVKVLELDIPAEAKIIYSVLADRISYSNYKDERGSYFFLSSKEKAELLQLVPCKKDSFKKYMRILRERDLIVTKQYGTGTRIYLGSRWVKKSTTEISVVGKTHDSVVENSRDSVVGKTHDPLNQLNQNNTPKQHNDIDICITCPKFVDVLVYWRKMKYTSSPADFYIYYDTRDWKLGGEPVRSWERLADKWEERNFKKSY